MRHIALAVLAGVVLVFNLHPTLPVAIAIGIPVGLMSAWIAKIP